LLDTEAAVASSREASHSLRASSPSPLPYSRNATSPSGTPRQGSAHTPSHCSPSSTHVQSEHHDHMPSSRQQAPPHYHNAGSARGSTDASTSVSSSAWSSSGALSSCSEPPGAALAQPYWRMPSAPSTPRSRTGQKFPGSAGSGQMMHVHSDPAASPAHAHQQQYLDAGSCGMQPWPSVSQQDRPHSHGFDQHFDPHHEHHVEGAGHGQTEQDTRTHLRGSADDGVHRMAHDGGHVHHHAHRGHADEGFPPSQGRSSSAFDSSSGFLARSGQRC